MDEADPMLPPPPDTKDWTWVLHEVCPECGVESARIQPTDVPTLARANALIWESVLADDAAARVRPSPEIWSPVEYACHVRDVFEVFTGRLQLMVAEDGARFQNWDQDEAAVEGDYAHAEPSEVAVGVVAAAERVAAAWEAVPRDAWERQAVRSNGSVFTVTTLSQYFAHDWLHHAWDVTGVQPLL